MLEERAIRHSGFDRTCHIYAPRESNRAPALVLVLHGGGGDGKRIAQITRFTDVAEQEGFCVAYPDAVDTAWNDGRESDPHEAEAGRPDDVAFLAALIKLLVEECGADPARVYVAGASNGAMMAHRLACERSSLIAGIGMVMGAIPANLVHSLTPSEPVPAIIMHGTDDPIVPWEGGVVRVGSRELGRVTPVRDTVAFWVQHNHAAPDARREWLPKSFPESTMQVWREVHRAKDRGADVTFYGIEGGGHTWPGGEQYLAEWIIGKTNRDIDASRVIWDFLKSCAKRPPE